jgi:putative SOS response-associated peptidase YedK
MLVPFPADAMTAYPVHTFVNDPRRDDASCIEPLIDGDDVT